MNICYFGDFNPDYARNRVIIKSLKEAGHSVVLCRTEKKGWRRYGDIWRMFRDLDQRWDMIIVGYSDSRLMAILACLIARCRVVWDPFYSLYDSWVNDRKIISSHGLKANYHWFIEWIACKSVDLILLDTYQHQHLFRDLYGVSYTKMIRVLVGSDPEVFHPQSIPPQEKITVHFHGHFVPLQGVNTIVRAISLLQDDPAIQFRIVGRGQEYAAVKKYADDHHLKNIEWIDHLSLEDLSQAIRESDICLGIFGTTPKAYRVVPNKVYEALASSRALITGDTPAIRELSLQDNGVVVIPMGDPEALAEAIRTLAHHEQERNERAQKGHEFFLSNATPEKIGHALSHDLQRNRIAIYTAIFGEKDVLPRPAYISEGCDFICFTDNGSLETHGVWQLRVVDPPLFDPVRSARMYKILAHKFLPEYHYSIWTDANLILRGDARRLIDTYLFENNFAVYNHGENKKDPVNSVQEEMDTLVEKLSEGKSKDDLDLMKRQVAHYMADKFPDTLGQVVTMVLVRRHMMPDVIKAMEAWWKELEAWSRRDQLSFNYIAWKTGLRFRYIRGDSRNNQFFLRRPHAKKGYATE